MRLSRSQFVGIAALLLSSLVLTGCPDDNANTSSGGNPPGFLTFTNGQAASIVLGQTDFISSSSGTSSTKYTQPQDVLVGRSGTFWITDAINNRVLGFHSVPSATGAAADFVVGQTNFTSNSNGSAANQLNTPYAVADNGVQFFVSDRNNNRIQVFNTIPTADNPSADWSIGSVNPSTPGVGGCTQTTMQPFALYATLTYLYVADANCNRVLIFQLPIASNLPSAVRVIGQSNFTNSAASLSQSGLDFPLGVWSNDVKLLIGDGNNNRLLVYNSFPTTNGPNADVVLGQSTFTSNVAGVTTQNSIASSNNLVGGVTSNGQQVFFTDADNSRVLIWNTWPASNGQNADVVLGQPNFTSSTNAITATGLSWPWSLSLTANELIVSDWAANRIMIWKSQ